MFWRKSREAIRGFHPAHQQLTMERTVSMSAAPHEWTAVLSSLSQHAATVKRRKWQLPSRSVSVLVPLVQVLCEDTAANGLIGVQADLRGSDVPGKAGPQRELPVRTRHIRKITEWFTFDPWLRVRAELRDGSVLEIRVMDRTRHRKIHKVNYKGKHKWKRKKKAVQRIDARRTLPRGAVPHRPPASPPGWISVRIKDGKRTTLSAVAKLSRVPEEKDQFPAILTVVTELFRWTTPETPRRSA